jgi:hypothetical protein
MHRIPFLYPHIILRKCVYLCKISVCMCKTSVYIWKFYSVRNFLWVKSHFSAIKKKKKKVSFSSFWILVIHKWTLTLFSRGKWCFAWLELGDHPCFVLVGVIKYSENQTKTKQSKIKKKKKKNLLKRERVCCSSQFQGAVLNCKKVKAGA